MASGVSAVEILARCGGELRRMCKLSFTKKDASIYIIPYATGGMYFFGDQDFPQEEVTRTFTFTEQLNSDRSPKLSIHETGRVHIRFEDKATKPIKIPALTDLEGEHVATVSVDRFDKLPLPGRNERAIGRAVDFIMGIPEGVVSGRVAIYINGREPNFKSTQIQGALRIIRPTLASPLWVGIAPIGQEPIAPLEAKQGVTVIAFNPTEPTKFLYLRGQ